MHLKIWGAIALASLAWGTTGVATRAALGTGLTPLEIVAIRAVLAVAMLYPLLRIRGRRLTRDRRMWGMGAFTGVFQMGVPFVTTTVALQYASAGFVGLLVALIPLATAVIAHFALDEEPMTSLKLGGLVAAFAGVGVLLASGDSGLVDGGRPILAAVLTIVAVVSIGYSTVYVRRRAGTYDSIELTFLQFVAGSVLLGALAVAVDGISVSPSAWGWVLIVYLTVAGSVVPFTVFYWLLHHVTSTKASLVGYVVPLVALVSGVVFLDEQIQAGIGVGGALILAGILIADRAERRAGAQI